MNILTKGGTYEEQLQRTAALTQEDHVFYGIALRASNMPAKMLANMQMTI